MSLAAFLKVSTESERCRNIGSAFHSLDARKDRSPQALKRVWGNTVVPRRLRERCICESNQQYRERPVHVVL